MKHLVYACAVLAAGLTTASAIAAPAGSDACQAIAARLSQKAAEFVQVNADGKAPAQASNLHLVEFYHGVSKKDAALRDIANEIWTLRTDMASRKCSQADAFTY
jgi:hypothetical protein